MDAATAINEQNRVVRLRASHPMQHPGRRVAIDTSQRQRVREGARKCQNAASC